MTVDAVLAPSTLPFALPDFATFAGTDFPVAFAEGFTRHHAEIAAIAENPEPATFTNTIEAMERAGRELSRVASVFFSLTSTDRTDELEAAQAAISPQWSAHFDAIHMDRALFGRIDDLYSRRDALGLDAEQLRLVERYHLRFTRAGAGLDDAAQARVGAINTELAELTTEFSRRTLAETNASAVQFATEAELDGLDADTVGAARAAAEQAGRDGYLLALGYPLNQPNVARLTNRESRRKVFDASSGRNTRGGENDTRELIARIAGLRAERAALFGYPHHAAYQIADQTAGTAEAALGMLRDLAGPAARNAAAERAELEEIAGHPIEAWDWPFYARIAEQRGQTGEGSAGPALSEFFELGAVVEKGVFEAARRMYGLEFTERTDLVLHHPAARAWQVAGPDGAPLGLFVGDYFARPSKRGGAWMTSFVDQSRLLDAQPVIINVCNFVQPPAGRPALLTRDEVTTVFHEFGHALHGLLSAVTYPYFSGTSVPRDFVEFPSQFNEMFAAWPTILDGYARHHETGEPLPAELRRSVLEPGTRGEGFSTVEYLGAAVIDLAWHTIEPGTVVDDVAAFEAAALADAGLDVDGVPPRYRGPFFNHIFSGGYSAGYYSYIWSEVLDADAAAWFTAHDGPTRENGEKLRAAVLSRGGSVDASQAYRDFRGADPDITPLLERRGLN
ncbi:M3 family metallopeptidase [Tsukamurella sp. PLM1]|uniref:M3 family metallopeptidase n=1 Tax=Tsukamurella sp. PLM1 TaxID=2929795 RepID=UPI0020664559|nr:M3 family metallopeptidase [Tsukamurella sp. PLM1]BDH58279.1 peptidyl-dipeptidase Dcp [Tsukamurella sp. PLM1]